MDTQVFLSTRSAFAFYGFSPMRQIMERVKGEKQLRFFDPYLVGFIQIQREEAFKTGGKLKWGSP